MDISLYIHIPFCKQKCNYCDFYSVKYTEDNFNSFLTSIKKEWEMIKMKFLKNDYLVKTIFLGGGTPSIISKKNWNIFNKTFLTNINKSKDCEYTLECNPESFTEEKAINWLNSGVNRLSIGIQSLIDSELEILGRVHNKSMVFDLLNSPILQEFNSINTDIMFALPDQTPSSINKTLQSILSFDVIKHLSIYELTISKGTSFYKNKKSLSLPNDNLISKMNNEILDILKTHKFTQYEVSNFAKKGYECKHNLNYWNYSPYLGLGPGAHSFLPPKRFANIANLNEYVKQISNHKLPFKFEETLTNNDIISELIFLGLRTSKGINEIKFKTITGSPFINNKRINVLNHLKKDGYLIHDNNFWKPTSKGLLFADSIAEKLI